MEFFLPLVGYIVGSLPAAYFIARKKGINLHSVGSKSAGGTNLGRALGWRWGALAILVDVTKSFLLVLLAKNVEWAEWLPFLVVGTMAMGSIFPVFLRFKGGKGFAVLLGGTIPLVPWPILLALVVLWIVLMARTRTMSFANVLITAIFGVVFVAFHATIFPHGIYAAFTVFTVFFSHRGNLMRMWKGTEPQISPQ